MERMPREINKRIDELIRGVLRNPPRRNDGTIIEEKVAAQVRTELEGLRFAYERDTAQSILWMQYIYRRVKQIVDNAKGTVALVHSLNGQDPNLALEEGQQHRRYHRVPKSYGYAVKETENVTIEENRRLQGEYRKRRLQNARYERYHAAIDKFAVRVGMSEVDEVGGVLQVLPGANGVGE